VYPCAAGTAGSGAAARPVVAQPAKLETTVEQNFARPERGHLFNIKPISHQGAPLRMSRLPD